MISVQSNSLWHEVLMTDGKAPLARKARKIFLPRFLLTEVCEATDEGAVRIALPTWATEAGLAMHLFKLDFKHTVPMLQAALPEDSAAQRGERPRDSSTMNSHNGLAEVDDGEA